MPTPQQPSESQAPKAEQTPKAELGNKAPIASSPRPEGLQPAKPRSLLPALAATALAGALLGLGGSYGLQQVLERPRINPLPSDDRQPELNARLDAIESKEEAAAAASHAALSALETRVAAAEGAARNAAELAKTAESDIQKAGASLQAAQAPPDGSPARSEPPNLGPLESRLAAVEQKLAQSGSGTAAAPSPESSRSIPPSDDRLNEFKARLDAIESKEAAASSASQETQTALEARIAAAVGAARAEPPDLGPLESRLTALEQKLAQSEVAAPKTSVRAEADREKASANETARAQEVAIVASNLLRKLDHGEEFSAELAALETMGIPQPELAPLHAAATSAVPTERELTARFADLTGKIIAAKSTAPEKESEGILGRLTRKAQGLVDVRRVGDSSAADVQSLVTRIESALADHDIEAAYKAWTELPSAAKEVAQSWGEAAKSRLDAVNAAKSLEADAVAVLGKPQPQAAEPQN